MSIEVLKQIWPEWQIEGKPLGRGSYGVVYKAVRRDHGVESYAAIKVISIPSDPSEVDSLRSEGLNMDATRTYLQGIVNDFVSEIQLMESLKGIQNIVSVEDYKVVEKTEEIGWDIYIRMELLTPFNTYICDKKLTEEEVIKLGCDICTALEICGQRNIIHRDIKPENIFINDFGYFKLGDFGIARKMENLTGGLSQKGTFNYMAPEVSSSSEYDARVDTYSLGIVLYRLLNENRLPFLDTEKQLLNPNERKNAVDRRLRGEKLPAPCNASPAMTDVILRACAYDPDMRFSSATEMKQALMSVANGTYQMTTSSLNRTASVQRAPDNYDKTTSVRKVPVASNPKSVPEVSTFGSAPKKKNKMPAVIAAVLIFILFVGTGIYAVPKLIGNREGVENEEASGSTPSETVDYSNHDEEQIDSIIREAEALAAKEDCEGALAKIKSGLATYPKSEALQEKEIEYNDMLAEQIKSKTLEEAANLAESGDYVSAIALIQNAQDTNGRDVDYTNAYNSYCDSYKTETINVTDDLASKGDYINAIQKINQAVDTIGNDNIFTEKKSEYEDAYVSEVELQSNKYIEAKDFKAADEIIQSAFEKFPQNEKLHSLRSKVDGMRPVELKDLTISDSQDYDQLSGQSVVKDTVGNIYSTENLFSLDYCTNSFSFKDQSFATYYLGRVYSTMSLTLAVSYDGGDTGSCLTIYGNNDTVLYTTGTTGRQFAPALVEIDVSGLDWITFRISDNDYRDHIVWLIANPCLYK